MWRTLVYNGQIKKNFCILFQVSAKKKPPLDTGGARLLVRGADYGIKSDPDQSRLLQDKKPLIKYYFFAYGVPTLIVIVTASTAGIDNYQNDEFCYLASSIKVSMVPFIGGETIFTLKLFFERFRLPSLEKKCAQQDSFRINLVFFQNLQRFPISN